ncbi:magnesium transporter NIPA-domain-containing protein [Mycena epipterygia]|nr:magnesium transporter NIPA-domain-containing protein [Mycena epipterygia]
MVDDKYIGLALAVTSSFAIEMSTLRVHCGQSSPVFRVSRRLWTVLLPLITTNPVWWAGMSASLISCQAANFAAYTFAPQNVTPLGALSVIIGAILASFLLQERLGHLGRVGCVLCLLGSSIIVLHAPEDQALQNVTQFLDYVVQPGLPGHASLSPHALMRFFFTVCVFSVMMAYGVAPKYGRTNPLVYISITSLVGSVSVMFVKGFGRTVKLTFAGHNYCIMVQLNYSNRALDVFSVNLVNPMYYVGFCTATIVASLILFKGFNTMNATNTVSFLCGFIVTFLGVHILNFLSMLEDSAAQAEATGNVQLEGRLSLNGTISGRRGLLRTPLFGGFNNDVEEGETVLLEQLLEEDEDAVLLSDSRSSPITSPGHPNIRISPRSV